MSQAKLEDFPVIKAFQDLLAENNISYEREAFNINMQSSEPNEEWLGFFQLAGLYYLEKDGKKYTALVIDNTAISEPPVYFIKEGHHKPENINDLATTRGINAYINSVGFARYIDGDKFKAAIRNTFGGGDPAAEDKPAGPEDGPP